MRNVRFIVDTKLTGEKEKMSSYIETNTEEQSIVSETLKDILSKIQEVDGVSDAELEDVATNDKFQFISRIVVSIDDESVSNAIEKIKNLEYVLNTDKNGVKLVSNVKLDMIIDEKYYNFLKENLYINEEVDLNKLNSFDVIEDKIQGQCAPGYCDDDYYYKIVSKIVRALGVPKRDMRDIYIYIDEYNGNVSPEYLPSITYTKETVKGVKADVYNTQGGKVLIDYTMSDSYPVLWFKNYDEAVNYLEWADGVNSQ